MGGVALIWLAAFATICNPVSVDPASAMVRAAVWRQTEPLFAGRAPEVRREAIRRAQLFGLAEAYPGLVREAFGEEVENRKAALRAIRRLGNPGYGNLVIPGNSESELDEERIKALSALRDGSGATELFGLYDYAEGTLAALRSPQAERRAYLRKLMEDLGEDYEYGPDDVPGGCAGIRISGGPEAPLRFFAERSRVDFIFAVREYLADPEATAQGQLIDQLIELKMVHSFGPSILPLINHPRTGVRVPAMLAMGGKLPIAELKKRMEEDLSGAVRLAAFWALAGQDEEMALKLSLPRLAKIVKDERFQVLATLYDAPNGRKRLQALAQHKDKTVAKEVRELLREIDEQERDTIRP